MSDRSTSPLGRVTVGLIGAYQRWVSPATAAHCRYLPTCSAYAAEAIESHGLLRGGALALRRVGRCHPLRAGGYDPVPVDASASPTEVGR